MALQSSGQISLNNIATEFKIATPLSNVGLSSFYKTTSAHYLQVYFGIASETTYVNTAGRHWNVDGSIRVYVNGLSGNYTVGVNGRSNINLSANWQNAYFTGFSYGSYTITVTDNVNNTVDTFSIYLNYDAAGASSITNYTNYAWNTIRLGQSLGDVVGKVKGIPANTNIPTSGQIQFSNFYGAAYYYLSVYFTITSETYYTNTAGTHYNSDGTIRVYLSGSANNYRVSVSGRADTYFTNNGGNAYYTGFGSGSYSIVVSDANNNIYYAFTAVVTAGTSYVVGRNLNTWHNIA